MDALFLPFPSFKDSLRGCHLRLSPPMSSRNHVSEVGAAALTPDLEQSAEQEIAEGLKEVGGEFEDENVPTEKREDEGGGENGEGEKKDEEELGNEQDDGEAQDEEAGDISSKSKEKSGEMEEEQGRSNRAVESDEVEDECCDIEDEEEDDSDGKVKPCVESQGDEMKDKEENEMGSIMKEEAEVQADEEEEESEEGSDKVDESLKNDTDEDESDKKRDERSGDSESKEEEIEGKSEAGQEKEKDEEGESEEGLERCSLSQRKLTESDEEVLERCVQSGGGEMEEVGMEREEESDAQKPQTASESEEEVVEVFEMETAQVQPAEKKMLRDLKSCDQKRKTFAGEMKSVTNKSPPPAEVGFATASVCVHTPVVLNHPITTPTVKCKHTHVHADPQIQLHYLRGCCLIL